MTFRNLRHLIPNFTDSDSVIDAIAYRFSPMKSEPCVASWESFVGACPASEKPVIHQRLIASRAGSHKVQDESRLANFTMSNQQEK
jgi:hypothetical protein